MERKIMTEEKERETPSTAPEAVPLPLEGGTGKKRTVLYPPCDIGDTAFYVGQWAKEPPFIECYTVSAVMWDGEKWCVAGDFCCFNEIGTDEAILDEGAALARFRELRDEYIKNGGKI
jgi:hypothetical protein